MSDNYFRRLYFLRPDEVHLGPSKQNLINSFGEGDRVYFPIQGPEEVIGGKCLSGVVAMMDKVKYGDRPRWAKPSEWFWYLALTGVRLVYRETWKCLRQGMDFSLSPAKFPGLGELDEIEDVLYCTTPNSHWGFFGLAGWESEVATQIFQAIDLCAKERRVPLDVRFFAENRTTVRAVSQELPLRVECNLDDWSMKEMHLTDNGEVAMERFSQLPSRVNDVGEEVVGLFTILRERRSKGVVATKR